MFGSIDMAQEIGCSLRSGTPIYILTLDFRFICPFVVIKSTDSGVTTVVAQGRITDNFLPIPDAESLPLYSMVSKLACVYRAQLSLNLKYIGIVAQHLAPMASDLLKFICRRLQLSNSCVAQVNR